MRAQIKIDFERKNGLQFWIQHHQISKKMLFVSLHQNQCRPVLYYYLKATDSPVPRFYCQPKIHKPRVPICPIVSYSATPLYNLNNYIAYILKPYVKDENNNAKNSTTFFNYIRNVFIEDNEIMVSFDVTSLYTNIVLDYINNDD